MTKYTAAHIERAEHYADAALLELAKAWGDIARLYTPNGVSILQKHIAAALAEAEARAFERTAYACRGPGNAVDAEIRVRALAAAARDGKNTTQ